MNGKEILLNTLQCKPAPRVPWVPFTGVHAATLVNKDAEAYLKDADAIVEGILECHKKYQPDGLPVVFDLQIEAEVLGCELKWAKDTPPAVATHPLDEDSEKTIADLPEFSLEKGRFPLVLDAFKRVKETIGETTALYGLVVGPFTLALHLRGDDIFLDMYEEEEAVEELLAYCADICCKVAEAYRSAGADVIAIVDPMVSQISPEHFTQFVSKPLNVVFDAINNSGALSSLFVCGNATRNLEVMAQTNCHNMSIDENIDLALLREIATKHNKSFGGNLKLTTVLLMGNETDAMKNTLDCLDKGGENGYVLAPGCDLPFDIPPANLEAVVKVLKDPYQRDVVRELPETVSEDDYADIEFPDYSDNSKTWVDVVTLDAAGCAPCQYMLEAAEEAAKEVGDNVIVREHMIKNRNGLAYMTKLSVVEIPTICISGKPVFGSIIPDRKKLVEAIQEGSNS